MQEEYVNWDVPEIPKGEYDIVKIVQDVNGTSIVLFDENIEVTVLFDDAVFALCTSTELLRTRTSFEEQIRRSNRYGLAKWPFYKVENSKFLEWARNEDYGFYRDIVITHYSIITGNDYVDILSSVEPIVTSRPLPEEVRKQFFSP